MKKNDSLATIWEIPDDLWAIIEPELPPVKPPGTAGRPPANQRAIFNGIFWVLRTGCQWKATPKQIGAGSTLHDYHQRWQRSGVYARIWGRLLELYEETLGIGFEWQSVDCCMTKAPLGGQGCGPNPTDRAKSGTKRSILVDERGVPLSVEIDGANVPDAFMLADTLASILIDRPEDVEENLCLDKAYDSRDSDACVEEFGYRAHTRRRREEPPPPDEPRHHPKRWVSERTHSWMNRFRRLLIRWEKKIENFWGLVAIAAVIIIYRTIRNAGFDLPDL